MGSAAGLLLAGGRGQYWTAGLLTLTRAFPTVCYRNRQKLKGGCQRRRLLVPVNDADPSESVLCLETGNRDSVLPAVPTARGLFWSIHCWKQGVPCQSCADCPWSIETLNLFSLLSQHLAECLGNTGGRTCKGNNSVPCGGLREALL